MVFKKNLLSDVTGSPEMTLTLPGSYLNNSMFEVVLRGSLFPIACITYEKRTFKASIIYLKGNLM